MKLEEQVVEVSPRTRVSSVWAWPDTPPSVAVVLAPGAGSDLREPMLSFVHEALAASGALAVKFNFAYREEGRRAPDPPAKLEATFRAVAARVREWAQPARLLLGGKSMGGRMATHLAAQGDAVDGLVLLGYPLHPPGHPEKLRDAHLPAIRCPVLFVQGTRDDFCDLALLGAAHARMTAPVTLHLVQDGDHSFKVPKRAGKTRDEVWREVAEVACRFAVGSSRSTSRSRGGQA